MFWNRKKADKAPVEADIIEGISEPVVTLIRLIQDEPERFDVSENLDDENPVCGLDEFSARDKHTGVDLSFCKNEFLHCLEGKMVRETRYVQRAEHKWMTESEANALFKELFDIWRARRAEFEMLAQEEIQKTKIAERQRLTEIYCGEQA